MEDPQAREVKCAPRLLWAQEVAGSIPATSTIPSPTPLHFSFFFLRSPAVLLVSGSRGSPCACDAARSWSERTGSGVRPMPMGAARRGAVTCRWHRASGPPGVGGAVAGDGFGPGRRRGGGGAVRQGSVRPALVGWCRLGPRWAAWRAGGLASAISACLLTAHLSLFCGVSSCLSSALSPIPLISFSAVRRLFLPLLVFYLPFVCLVVPSRLVPLSAALFVAFFSFPSGRARCGRSRRHSLLFPLSPLSLRSPLSPSPPRHRHPDCQQPPSVLDITVEGLPVPW